MKVLRIILAIVGVLALLMGLLWASQGSGIFPYPATSPMINQSPWIWKGAILAIVGPILVARLLGLAVERVYSAVHIGRAAMELSSVVATALLLRGRSVSNKERRP